MLQEGQTISIGGWVKTGREAGAGRFVFLDVNDGTSAQGLQAGSPHCSFSLLIAQGIWRALDSLVAHFSACQAQVVHVIVNF